MPEFSRRANWFKQPARQFAKTVLPFAGLPIAYLEVGVFEGRSAVWMLDHVLTHREARAVCVDPWSGAYERYNLQAVETKARANLAPYGDKVRIIKGFSPEVIEPLPDAGFEVAYIDGLHKRKAVLADSLAVWPKVKLGGFILWDDWQNEVEDGVADFLATVRDCYQVVSQGYQLHIRKVRERS